MYTQYTCARRNIMIYMCMLKSTEVSTMRTRASLNMCVYGGYGLYDNPQPIGDLLGQTFIFRKWYPMTYPLNPGKFAL